MQIYVITFLMLIVTLTIFYEYELCNDEKLISKRYIIKKKSVVYVVHV